MLRTTTVLKILLISLLILLSAGQAGSVSAGTNVWTSNGPEGGTINALAIDPLTPTILYAGTEGGGVFKSTNGGENWNAVNTGLTSPRVRALAIDPLTPTNLYAGTWSGGVFKSTDGGASWNAINTGLTDTNIRSLVIDPKEPSILHAGTYTGGVFKSTNDGQSWSAVSTGLPTGAPNWLGAMAIDPVTPTTLYVGISDDVYKSTNGGADWSPANVGLPVPDPYLCEIQSLAIDPVTPTTLYVGASSCGVYKSTNGGASWSATKERPWGTTIHALAIDPQAATLYAGTDYAVFKSPNGGENWIEVTIGLPDIAQVYSLAIDPVTPAILYAGLADGGVFKSTNAAGNWSAVNTGLAATTVSALVIDPTTPSMLYGGTEDEGVFKSTNGGRSWSSANHGLWSHANFEALAIDPATPSTLYLGTPGGIFKSTDSGGIWTSISEGLPSNPELPWVRSLVVDPIIPTTVYAGTWGGVFKSVNGGQSWSASSDGLPGYPMVWPLVWPLAIDPTAPNILYAGILYGGMFKSLDGGQSWHAINTGLTNSDVATLAIDPKTPVTVYAGTDGGVFKSTDGGDNWSKINTGLTNTAIRSLAIDPMTPATLYAGTTSGVFKSTNGGASWNAFDAGLIHSEVRALAIDPVTPTTLYAGMAGGGVFKIQQVEYSCDGVSGIPSEECEALVALYNSTDGLNWTHNDGWLVTKTPCSWYGVTCQTGHVQELVMSYNGLTGSLPSDLSNLTRLEVLRLDHNQLSGGIPPAFGQLDAIREINLGGNQLNSIPNELGNLTGLTSLLLGTNQLSSIPTSLCKLSNLSDLALDANLLSGPVPSCLGQLTNLWALNLGENQLSGTISWVNSLTDLENLYLRGNQFSGGIPLALSDFGHLRVLELDHNLFSGLLPHSMTKLNLYRFHYGNTNLCEPLDVQFQAWLAGISDLERTGVMCKYISYLPLVFQHPEAVFFWANRYWLAPGECTTLHWSVPIADTLAVYLDGQGVAGEGIRQVCPVQTTTYVLRVVKTSGETREHSLTITVGTPHPAPILVDDFAPQPQQGQSVYSFNRLGGDRGAVNNSILEWGHGQVTTTVSAGNSWGGAWMSLNHPIREGLPINFSAILPAQILPAYQSQITGITFDIAAGTPGRLFKLELKDGAELRWKREIVLSGGQVGVPLELPPLGNINHLVWVLDRAAAGDSVVLDDIRFMATTYITDTATAAFVWSYGQLLNNWNPATGLVRDKATDTSGEFDAVQATGSLAAATAQAEQLGVISRAAAVQIVNKIGDTLLRKLPRSHGLWPHWVKVSPAGEIAIVPGAEWSSLDTVIAALGLLTAQAGLGLDTTATEQMLRDIDWSSLVTPGGISHGYTDAGTLIPYAWDTFGGESWLVELAYAAATGQVAPMTYPSPPTANSSGFIDELAWLFVPPPAGRDYWGTDWAAYRSEAADRQIDYYPTHHPESCFSRFGLFGLSAGEVPDPARVPLGSIYQAYGVGGRFAPANDGAAALGAPVVTPHYAAMIASLRPAEATTMWKWLMEERFLSPLNNVESLMFPPSAPCWSTEVVWNQLKGSWNLALQTLGWGRYLALRRGQQPILWEATKKNSFLRSGYDILAPDGPSPGP